MVIFVQQRELEMSQDNKDISRLLSSIQSGLQKYTIKQLNNALISILNNDYTQSEVFKIDYALQIVCEEYNITIKVLMNKTLRGEIYQAKILAFCLLYFNLGLTIRQIANNVFNCYPTSVARAIKKIKYANMNMRQEEELVLRYKLLSKRLTENINKHLIQHKEHENIS